MSLEDDWNRERDRRLAAEHERDEWKRECLRWRDEAGVDGPFDALVAERDALAAIARDLLADQ